MDDTQEVIDVAIKLIGFTGKSMLEKQALTYTKNIETLKENVGCWSSFV